MNDGNTILVSETLVEASLKQEGTYTWAVENFTELAEGRVYSPEFEVGGYFWSVLLFPKGNEARGSADHISVYLHFSETPYTPNQMFPTAMFELIAVKSTNPLNSIKRRATHTFTARAKSLGFPEFLRLRELQNPGAGYLVNDVLTLRVKIYIQGNDNLGMISRAKTGLMNVESSRETSLLSSFLLCLFHIKRIRKAVFEMPSVTSDDPQNSLSLLLQHLFYKLQYQKTSVKINDLIRALDWDCDDVRLQHDTRKIENVICEELGREMKVWNSKDWISEILTGEYSKYIASPSLEDQPSYKQPFMGIPLDVLGCKDIYASLEKFCQIERLTKDSHRYMTSHEEGSFKHSMLFDRFPTVLLFHLKRCRYNPDRGGFLKINSHYEFYDDLDLDYNDRVLQSHNADRTIENKHRLHSMVVHAGSPKEGNYFVFVRHDEKWFKFDDEVVKQVSTEEAINEQVGDQNGTASANFSKGFKNINNSAAVMLVYIRKSEWERVMCEARKEDIPNQVRRIFDKEQRGVEKRRMKEEGHFYVNIKLAAEFHFAEQMGKTYYSDLADFNSIKNYRIHKKTPFEDFKELVSTDFGIPIHLQRFWRWKKRTNNTVRVSEPLVESITDLKTVLDLRNFRDKDLPSYQTKYALFTIVLFLEAPEETVLKEGTPGNTLHPIQRNELLIFFKYYDPKSKKLFYLGHMFIEKTCRFCVIFEKAKMMAGLAPEDKIIGFEEVKHLPAVTCSVLSPHATPERWQMVQGDIIIIQKRHNLREVAMTVVKGLTKHAKWKG